jgi:hypothetical protein
MIPCPERTAYRPVYEMQSVHTFITIANVNLSPVINVALSVAVPPESALEETMNEDF